jgi:hypothetical protein
VARHDTYIERTESSSGVASGVLISIVVVLLVAILALFMAFGGPSRFIAGPTPPTTNVNAPVQGQPQGQPRTGPEINVPRQIDINVNQAPAQPPSGQQAPGAPIGSRKRGRSSLANLVAATQIQTEESCICCGPSWP